MAMMMGADDIKPVIGSGKKIHVCGEGLIDDRVTSKFIFNYYLEQEGARDYVGPPVEAVRSAEFVMTGRWKWAGDAENPRIDIECRLIWATTPRTMKWLSWPPMKVIKADPVIHEILVWVREDDVVFRVIENINDCREECGDG